MLTITYYLSEDGRRASLLAGGDGRSEQSVAIAQESPLYATLLQAARIDDDGRATIVLTTAYHGDALPAPWAKYLPETIDTPQTADQLAAIILAARAAHAEAEAERAREYERRNNETVEQILATPTPTLIYHGRDGAEAGWALNHCDDPRIGSKRAEVQAECDRLNAERAKRLAEADAREACAKAAAEAEAAAECDALRQAVALYSPTDLARWDDGLMAKDEALRIVRDELFRPLADQPRYERMTCGDVEHAEDCMEHGECDFEADDAESTSAAEYATLVAIRAAISGVSGAVGTVRTHRARCCDCGATASRTSIRVSVPWRTRTMTREYAA